MNLYNNLFLLMAKLSFNQLLVKIIFFIILFIREFGQILYFLFEEIHA